MIKKNLDPWDEVKGMCHFCVRPPVVFYWQIDLIHLVNLVQPISRTRSLRCWTKRCERSDQEVCVGGQNRFDRIQSYDRPIGPFFTERKVAKHNMKHVKNLMKTWRHCFSPMTFGNPIRKSPTKCPRSVWNVAPLNASSTRNSRKEKSKPCYVERLWPIGIAVGIFIPHLGSRKNCLFSSVLHLLKAKVSKLFKTNEINKLSDMNHMNEIKWNEEWGNEKKDEAFSQNHGYFWLSIASSWCQRPLPQTMNDDQPLSATSRWHIEALKRTRHEFLYTETVKETFFD